MPDTTITLYAITHDHMEQWSGAFFADSDEARAELELMQNEIVESDSNPNIRTLNLEEMIVVLPANRDELIALLNKGPVSIIRERNILNIAYLNRTFLKF